MRAGTRGLSPAKDPPAVWVSDCRELILLVGLPTETCNTSLENETTNTLFICLKNKLERL